MTPRQTAVLAQVTALLLILVPGLAPGGAAVHAALVPPLDDPIVAAPSAAANGVGCGSASRRFRGPRVPGDPPPPPGFVATPPPSPAPSPGDPALEAESEEESANGPTILLASTRTAQAEPTDDPGDPDPDPDAVVDPDEGAAAGGADADADAEAPERVRREPSTRQRVRRAARAAGYVPGLDVSHHNGDIDWKQVKKAGRQFVFIKATQDTSFIDPMFTTNMAGARAAGLAAGAYHFFDYRLDGKAQADHFIDRVERADGILGALPPVVDIECWGPMGQSTHVLSEARLRDFVERVYERTGRLPIVYTSTHMWNQVMGSSRSFTDLPMWAACWNCALPISIAPAWDEWMFWQTGIDRVPGVKALDGNFFAGSKRDLNRLKLKPLRIEGGAPATGATTVRLSLGGRDAVALRTSPDGESWSEWQRIDGRATAELAPTEGEQTLHVQLRAGPGLRSGVYTDTITLDTTPPDVTPPAVTLRDGPIDPDAVPIAVSWVANDATAGLADGAVEVACGSAEPVASDAPGSAEPAAATAWSGDAAIAPAASCRVTAVARDGVGNAARAAGPAVSAELVTTDDVRVEATGPWQSRPETAVLGDASLAADGDGATLRATLDGRQAGVVAIVGPSGGRAEVLLDGEMVGLVDTYAAEAAGPQVVFTVDLEERSRALEVRPLGSAAAGSEGTDVLIDGFVVLS